MAAAVAPLPDVVVLPVIDGRKKKFYTAVFRDAVQQTEILDVPADEALRIAASFHSGDHDTIVATGPHANEFLLRLNSPKGLVADPSGRRGLAPVLAELALQQFDASGYDSVDIGPTYVRGSDAEISRRQHR